MGQHLVEVEARVVCAYDAAEKLMGRVDHVDFQPAEQAVDWTAPEPPLPVSPPPPGIARMRIKARGESSPIVLATEAMDRLDDATKAADIDIELGFEFTIRAEALVEVDGVWRRRGEVVPMIGLERWS